MNNHRSAKRGIRLLHLLCSFPILMFAFGWVISIEASPGKAISNEETRDKVAQPPCECTEWDIAKDFHKYPNQENPNRDSCGNLNVWHFMQSADFTRNPQTYSLLPYFTNSSSGILGLEKWTGLDYNWPVVGLPEFVMNATCVPQITEPGLPLFIIPPDVVAAHPSGQRFAIAGWQNPLEGNSVVSITGSVKLLNPYYPDGIKWYIDKGTANLASGSIENGGSQDFRNGTCGNQLDKVAVNKGDFIYFIIHPNNTFYGDSTQLDISIKANNSLTGLLAVNNGPTVLGATTTFEATVTAGTNISYSWDFGDVTFGNGQIVTHAYSKPGVYSATVTASNGAGEMIASTQVIINTKIFLPLLRS